jgi:hypothetical protein
LPLRSGMLWPKLNLGRFWSGAGAWITAASLYLNWLGLVLQGGFGSGPKAPSSPRLGSTALWERAGGTIPGMHTSVAVVGVDRSNRTP